MTTTLLVKFPTGERLEFPVSEGRRLGEEFPFLRMRESLAMDIAHIGGDPLSRGTVYGYILNRHEEFKHKYYGWALPRD